MEQETRKNAGEMDTDYEENVFALPWEDSNMVLVVEDQELHVHKWILTSQSPVFKAMFDGHFKEASQNRIALKEKDLRSMIQFLRLLYPMFMFSDSSAPLWDDEMRLSVMALADEYQCVNLLEQFIDEVKITPENALKILPYAVKYSDAALLKILRVTTSCVPTSQLEKALATWENKDVFNKILLNKCHFLESSVVEMQGALFACLNAYLNKVKKSTCIDSDSRCSHAIRMRDIRKTKSCPHCKEKYKEGLIAPLTISSQYLSTQGFYNVLLKADDVATEVEKQKK